MKMNWADFTGKTLNVVMFENYGVVTEPGSTNPIYEIVFKTGVLENAFDEGLLLRIEREDKSVYRVFIPHIAVKCVEIY
ncbi:MAG: hypothetical protein IAE91_05145 [Ignavibacteriaceae bacterium]|nr:hypothetical protein [Ignavibacteriaceae bacterium]